MAEDTEPDEQAEKRAKVFWMVVPGLLLVVTIGWLLLKMAAQTNGATLSRLAGLLLFVLLVVGVAMFFMRRRGES